MLRNASGGLRRGVREWCHGVELSERRRGRRMRAAHAEWRPFACKATRACQEQRLETRRRLHRVLACQRRFEAGWRGAPARWMRGCLGGALPGGRAGLEETTTCTISYIATAQQHLGRCALPDLLTGTFTLTVTDILSEVVGVLPVEVTRCAAGAFQDAAGECVSCSKHLDCSSAGLTLRNLKVSEEIVAHQAIEIRRPTRDA